MQKSCHLGVPSFLNSISLDFFLLR